MAERLNKLKNRPASSTTVRDVESDQVLGPYVWPLFDIQRPRSGSRSLRMAYIRPPVGTMHIRPPAGPRSVRMACLQHYCKGRRSCFGEQPGQGQGFRVSGLGCRVLGVGCGV